MLQLFLKKDGAISVFLSVILLPVLLVGFLTVDAAKMIMSKVVVSDAGEMAMNAALSQYDFQLKDEYGLLVMKKTPEDMNEELEKYFLQSLNGTGIDGAQDYDKILHLTNESFKALNIEASKIYKTEVEKQQILEYMKYRAPVCIAESLVKKVGEIKETSKMLKAIEKEIAFSKDMEKCQNTFEAAKEALDVLSGWLELISINDIKNKLIGFQKKYTQKVSIELLMYERLEHYSAGDQKLSNSQTLSDYYDVVEKFEKYVNQAYSDEEVGSKGFYECCINALYEKNTIKQMGGIDAFVNQAKGLAQNPAPTEEATQNENNGTNTSETETTKSDSSEEVEKLKARYQAAETKFLSCKESLKEFAKAEVEEAYNYLQEVSDQIDACEKSCEDAITKLGDIKKRIEKAAESHKEWGKAIQNLTDPKDMKEEHKEYEEVLNLDSIDQLIEKIQTNESNLKKLKVAIEGEKFFEQRIGIVVPEKQMSQYESEIKTIATAMQSYDYDSIVKSNAQCAKEYSQADLSSVQSLISIDQDECYKQIKERCEDKTKKNQELVDTGNKKLKEGQDGIKEILGKIKQLFFDWSETGMNLPSQMQGIYAASPEESGGTEEENIDDKKSRDNIISKMSESIKQASNFLDGLSGILTDNLENLYIAEYAMQMFSHYTVDKEVSVVNEEQKVKSLEKDKVIGLSGYKLGDHPGYPGEVEYILWGNNMSVENITKCMVSIFGIRLLCNSFFAFSDKVIRNEAKIIAQGVAGGAPYLIPIIKIVYKFSMAVLESVSDMKQICQGYGVTVIKKEASWTTPGFTTPLRTGDNTLGFTLNYEEYLRIFMNITMMFGHEKDILARIADCIQINTGSEKDITQKYTMVGIEAKVKTQTTFMKKIAEYSNYQEKVTDSYNILYQSVLGY